MKLRLISVAGVVLATEEETRKKDGKETTFRKIHISVNGDFHGQKIPMLCPITVWGDTFTPPAAGAKIRVWLRTYTEDFNGIPSGSCRMEDVEPEK